ncbi:MAG: 16S rRNA (guanine(966)-N(2))-methyltransferase RsmD [Anaerovoracaceae bacterium]|jgi:16S rRNA (guanine(966)-N(2))-methyltransferase RsmD|nr:16S rRNA (guanine(966)-N(2))-methyltransferase RsmD [Anaerovoracaceae bacterium]
MRIITGKYRGRRLETPRDYSVRPTSDRVKEAIFSMISQDIDQSIVLDLFAGTGSLGLEALSRGAKHCYFIDNERESIRLLKSNISYCKADNEATVFVGDFKYAMSKIKEAIDIAFLDPPYETKFLDEALEQVSRQGFMAPGGLVITEHGPKKIMPDSIGSLEKIKEKKYGQVHVTIYRAFS